MFESDSFSELFAIATNTPPIARDISPKGVVTLVSSPYWPLNVNPKSGPINNISPAIINFMPTLFI